MSVERIDCGCVNVERIDSDSNRVRFACVSSCHLRLCEVLSSSRSLSGFICRLRSTHPTPLPLLRFHRFAFPLAFPRPMFVSLVQGESSLGPIMRSSHIRTLISLIHSEPLPPPYYCPTTTCSP